MDPAASLASPRFNEYIEHEVDRVLGALATLDAAGWRRPVAACPGWDVREVVVHLAWLAELYHACILKALGGSPTTPWADPMAERQRRLERKRSLADAALLSELRRSSQLLQELLARLTPEQYTFPAWHRRGQSTVGRHFVYWFWELGIHGWDIRSAFDRAAGFDPEARPVLVEMLATALPRYLRPEADPRLTATYHFVLRDPERTVSVRIAGGTKEIVDGTEGAADVRFRLTGTDWVLAILGRLDPFAAMYAGRIVTEGDPAITTRFWNLLERY